MQYPVAIHENMGELAALLLSPPTPDELDERGCFSKEACAKVETLLLKDFEKQLKGKFFPEENDHGTNPNNRWRTVSCLQKAIRFGDRPMARFAASVGYDMDAKYVLRRLGVIAVEDVAMGNLYGTLMVLAAMGNSAWRQACDERRLVIALADLLASQQQDRNLTDWLNMASFDETVDREAMCAKVNEELTEIVLNQQRFPPERMVALWAMAGTKKYWGHNMPKVDRPPEGVFTLMVKQGLPRAMLYGAARTASRLSEAFWVSFYFAHEQLAATPIMQVIDDPMLEYTKVGKLLGASYDMHTREGKQAIGKFSHSCKDVAMFKPFLTKGGDWQTLVSEAVFAVEGGRLRHRAVYGNSEWIKDRSWNGILKHFGLPASQHNDFLAAVESNVPYLNKIRESILWAKVA